MSIETMWLQPYREKAGRDQLGIRATSVRMYDHLVPGITNVTDRARYVPPFPCTHMRSPSGLERNTRVTVRSFTDS